MVSDRGEAARWAKRRRARTNTRVMLLLAKEMHELRVTWGQLRCRRVLASTTLVRTSVGEAQCKVVAGTSRCNRQAADVIEVVARFSGCMRSLRLEKHRSAPEEQHLRLR